MPPNPKLNPELQLLELITSCQKDPLKFVKIAYPWQRGILAKHDGPDVWQTEVLCAIRDGLMTGQQAIQLAVSSGKGIGKSALVAWILQWALTTRPDTRGVVTANTMPQLMTKTWPEFSKWFWLLICNHWYELTATSCFCKDPKHEKTWRIDVVPWNETNPEAFAGLHNQGRRIILVMDEASGIADNIWETSDGILTDKDTEIVWCAFGNPTRNMGRFKECFGRFRHRWKTWQIDSRQVKITNHAELNRQVEEYGEDSDYVRIFVRGMFPRAGLKQFISEELVSNAMQEARDNPASFRDPLAIGVDIARFGDDATVIWFRRGPDARSIPPVKLRNADNMAVANELNRLIYQHKPQAVFCDAGGNGSGVIDRLREMGHRIVYGIDFGGSPGTGIVKEEGSVSYFNKRAEMWGSMRDWLRHGMVPHDRELLADLTGVQYEMRSYKGRDAIILEAKADMKKRGLASPDCGDALALTFAQQLPPGDFLNDFRSKETPKHQYDYNPYQDAYQVGKGQPSRSNSWLPHSNR